MIRKFSRGDEKRIAEIYNYYIRNSIATFEEEEISPKEILRRYKKVENSSLPWLVAVDNGVVSGYAYALPWHERSAYRHSVETTIYLSHSEVSKGIGTALYNELFKELKKRSIHLAIGCISLPNPESIALHEKIGMESVGVFKEVGKKFGKWIDVGYWQMML